MFWANQPHFKKNIKTSDFQFWNNHKKTIKRHFSKLEFIYFGLDWHLLLSYLFSVNMNKHLTHIVLYGTVHIKYLTFWCSFRICRSPGSAEVRSAVARSAGVKSAVDVGLEVKVEVGVTLTACINCHCPSFLCLVFFLLISLCK